MTATLAERSDLRGLSDADLLAVFSDGTEDEQAAAMAEADRRDRAERARKVRQAADAAWYDAAFAQYMAADAECRGHLFSAYGQEHGPADAFSLWRGSEAWAAKHASEELREFWYANGGRLSLARYRREMATARHAERDARDLEQGRTGPGKPRRKPAKWEGVPGGAVMEKSIRLGDVVIPAWLALGYESDTVTVHATRASAEQALAPQPAPEAPPTYTPDQAATWSALTARSARARERLAEIQARASRRAARKGN